MTLLKLTSMLILVWSLLCQQANGDGTTPSQQALDEIISQTTRFRILACIECSEESTTDVPEAAQEIPVRYESSDVREIASLQTVLAIVEDEGFLISACPEGPLVELYQENVLLATILIDHAHSIRWNAWKSEALIKDVPVLINWFAERGINEPKEAYEEALRFQEQTTQLMNQWRKAMPPCLQPYWKEISNGFLTPDITPMKRALDAAYPDAEQQALALFHWFGSGKGPWSGFPSYEEIPERLLLTLPTDVLIRTLINHELSSSHLEGAARYFAGWEFHRQKAQDARLLTPELKRILLEQSLRSDNDDNKSRATEYLSE